MGGALSSAGGFLGISSGPQAPAGQFGNESLGALNAETGEVASNQTAQNILQNASQSGDIQSAINGLGSSGLQPAVQQGLSNSLATGATTGTAYARQQMADDPTQQSLYGSNGQLGNTENSINQEENQGFNLTPGDNSLYGQESGQIANQFAQQGNQSASDLANRGLSSSGAAGASFSGIAGNQNQMLANAQQQIAQQRFSNTQNQIAQNQNYAAQLGSQYNNALNQQYGRQAQGAQQQVSGVENASGQQASANNAQNQYGMQAAAYNTENTPMNFMDMATGAPAAKFMSAGANAGLSALGSGGGSSSSMGAGGGTAMAGEDSGASAAAMAAHGGKVPGQPMFPNDNTTQDDTQDYKLSPGEVVLDKQTVKKLQGLFSTPAGG